MKLQVNLTQQIIIESKNCKNEPGENCAIANAIRDIFPDAMIGKDKIFFKKRLSEPFDFFFNAKDQAIQLPLAASIFINEFDNTNPAERVKMKPMSFEINVPDSLIDDIDISEIQDILSHSKTLQLA